MKKKTAGPIDEYIARHPPDVRRRLELLRRTIRAAAPEAEETISYGIPTFKQHGNLVHFAAWKNHIGFYPAASGMRQFAQELEGYVQSRGSVQFPSDQPIPVRLVGRIVKFRLQENHARVRTEGNARRTAGRP